MNGSVYFVLSTGEVLGFENLIFGIFEFVSVLIETSKFRDVIKKSCDQLLYYIILYMQMTEEQVGHKHSFLLVEHLWICASKDTKFRTEIE